MVMVERLRELADRPLDRGVAGAILILGLGVTIGVSLLVGLVTIGGEAESSRGGAGSAVGNPAPPVVPETARVPTANPVPAPEQDPQDRPGSVARSRAVAELRSHRALQHVPWRHGGVVIELAGASGSRAILRVVGPDLAIARRRYSSFLRRFGDRGHAYLPSFRARGTTR